MVERTGHDNYILSRFALSLALKVTYRGFSGPTVAAGLKSLVRQAQ